MNDQTELANAIRVLTAAGAVISLNTQRHFSLGNAARQLDCSKGWVREHIGEFPNAWRMPGGEIRVPETDVETVKQRIHLGELRIPAKDIEELAKRSRMQRP